MRRTLSAAGMVATIIMLAGCGGGPPMAAAAPTPAAVPALDPTPLATADPTPAPVPMAVAQLVPPASTGVAVVPAPAPTSRPVRPLAPALTPSSAPAPRRPAISLGTPPPVAAPPGQPAQPAPVVSDNWSGYVAGGGGHWQVSGSWTEPTVSCTASAAESVFWVGLGGYPSYPLYQAGSGAFCRNGLPIHALWYELLTPSSQAPVVAVIQIQPGDRISASISLRSGSSGGVIHLADQTAHFTTDVAFSPAVGSLGTAEWVAEATSHGGQVSTLADFGSVTFAGCDADLGAAGPAVSAAAQLTELDLVDRSGGRAEPGAISSSPAGGGGFSIAYSGA